MSMTWPLDDTDYTAEAIGAFAGARTRGVFATEECFRVTAAGGFRLRLTGGLAWLKKDKYWGVSVLEKEETMLTMDMGSGGLPRYAAVVLLLDKTANKTRIEVRYGDYSSTPQKPKPRRDAYYDEIIVATVLQRAGAVEITSSDITDERTNEALCGLMADGITRLPLNGLIDQLNDRWNRWFEDVKEQLSGDVAGQLIQKVNHLTERVTLAEYMMVHNDYFAPILDDDGRPILDDAGVAIVGDWTYQT